MNDPDLHLLVDDHEIQQYIRLERVINKPRKLGHPVVVSEKPWEGYRAQAWGSVIQEPDGLIRMWYFSFPARKPGETDVGGYCYVESRDGIHWARQPRRMVSARYGDYMMVTRDERNQRWWLNERGRALYGRTAALRTSTDLVNWSAPETIFTNTPDMGYGERYEWHGGITPFNYGNQNLGLLEKWSNAGFGDTCELLSNREGGPWERVAPDKPLLDVGAEGAFDRVLIYPTHNAPIHLGDELFIYYTGAGAWSPTADSPGMPMAIGVATLGRDRFAGLAHSRGAAGELLTRLLVVEKPNLQINVESILHPEVRLAVLAEDGSVFLGLDVANLLFETPWTDMAWKAYITCIHSQ